ncbi:MAG: hypothetical protein H7Y32_09020 [Chloroflexales bacterium]|nr:hypothetical protein [Chloroflexales bacterium]
MRKLIVSENVTLDGVVESPDLSYQSIDKQALQLVKTKAFDAGVVMLRYQPAPVNHEGGAQ